MDLDENENNSVLQIKQNQENQNHQKMPTSDILPHQPVLTSNTSAIPVLQSPVVNNLDDIPVPKEPEQDRVEGGNNQLKEVSEEYPLLKQEQIFIARNNDQKSENDDDMKINIQIQQDENDSNIQNEDSCDKSDSAISLNINKADDAVLRNSENNSDSCKIILNLNGTIGSQDNNKEPSSLQTHEIISQNEMKENKSQEIQLQFSLKQNNEEEKIQIQIKNLDENKDTVGIPDGDGPCEPLNTHDEDMFNTNAVGNSQNRPNQPQDLIMIEETDDECHMKLSGNFPKMNLEETMEDLPKRGENLKNSQNNNVSNNQDLKGKESVSDASNVISLKFSPNKNNDTFTENDDECIIKIPNFQTPDKGEDGNNVVLNMGDSGTPSDDVKISIPLVEDSFVEENLNEESTLFRIPNIENSLQSSKDKIINYVKDSTIKRKRNKKLQAKGDISTQGQRPRSDTFGEESKIEPTIIKDSIRNYYKLDMQKVTLKVQLKDPSKRESEDN